MLIKSLLICFLNVIVLCERFKYDNYALYKLIPENEDHIEFLKDLYENPDGLDFWTYPARVGDFVSVVSPPEIREDFEHSLKKRSISSDLMLENIQEAFDAQLYSRRKRDTSGRLFWTNYQTRDEIEEWFNELARDYPNVVTIINGGQSFEGRNITGIKISRGSGRRAFFLEGGQIGADWLSPTVLTYFIDQLVRNEDSEARALSNDFDWHIFPIVNPDGHEFSQNSVRLWVKNRRPQTHVSGSPIGVDLTRNWNSQWGARGGSFQATANNFVGIGPFSEPETRSLSRYIESIGSNLAGVLSFRSFGQRLIIPFAHTSAVDGSTILNYNEMVTIGRRAAGSLAVRYNTQYLVGTSRDVHDGATGVLVDWAKFRFNPPIAATYNLRDTGTWGYTLPVNQVLPSCEETFDSLLAIVREAKFLNVL